MRCSHLDLLVSRITLKDGFNWHLIQAWASLEIGFHGCSACKQILKRRCLRCGAKKMAALNVSFVCCATYFEQIWAALKGCCKLSLSFNTKVLFLTESFKMFLWFVSESITRVGHLRYLIRCSLIQETHWAEFSINELFYGNRRGFNPQKERSEKR